MTVYNYAEQFEQALHQKYAKELASVDLFNSNPQVKFINAQTIKLPNITVSGYKDHNRQTIGLILEQFQTIGNQRNSNMTATSNLQSILWMLMKQIWSSLLPMSKILWKLNKVFLKKIATCSQNSTQKQASILLMVLLSTLQH